MIRILMSSGYAGGSPVLVLRSDSEGNGEFYKRHRRSGKRGGNRVRRRTILEDHERM